MIVSFRRTGGFGGIALTASVDTATLPSTEARKLQKLVDRLVDAPKHRTPSSRQSPRPDAFQYAINVKDGRSTTRFDVDDGPDYRELLDYLTDKAMSRID